MTYTFTNPYTAKNRVYKGVCHCHSTNSDGLISPEAVIDYYKERNYDWVSITDHIPNNHNTMDTITPDPEVEGVLFISGVEYGYADVRPHQHVAELKPRELNDLINEDRTLKNIETQDELTIAKDYGSYTILSHPGSTKREYTFTELKTLKDYNAISVFNSGIWTNAHVDYALTTGHKAHIVAEADDHFYNGEIGYEGVAAVNVFANECTETEIMENLFAGNFYSTMCPSGDLGMEISVVNGEIFVELSETGRIMFYGYGGTLLYWADGTSVSYVPVSKWKIPYVRVVVNTLDPNWKMAWSNPLWLEVSSRDSVVSRSTGSNRVNVNRS